MKTLTHKDFLEMPWKNGGGTTTEFFSIRSSETQEILFRISEAKVQQDGPFSIFNNIDRILMLTSGEGFLLDFQDNLVVMDSPLMPIHFPGEAEIQCELIGGDCLDFNVMTNRHYGKSILNIHSLEIDGVITSNTDMTFIYLPTLRVLHVLLRNDSFHNESKSELLIYKIELRLLLSNN